MIRRRSGGRIKQGIDSHYFFFNEIWDACLLALFFQSLVNVIVPCRNHGEKIITSGINWKLLLAKSKNWSCCLTKWPFPLVGTNMVTSDRTNHQTLHNTTQWPQRRLMTFDTFDQSDQKIWPDPKKPNYLHTYIHYPPTELRNVNFFTQINSFQMNLPQEKGRKL